MHPDMHGKDILDSFQEGVFENYQGYEAFVRKFNRKFFGYKDELMKDARGYLKKSDVLSQEEFVDIIDRLREASDLQEQVNRIFRNSRENLENDFGNAAALQISHESTVVFLLKKVLCDKYDYIEYFIYELDYGRKYESGMITDENGQDIDIHTPELLYDFILDSGIIYQEEV